MKKSAVDHATRRLEKARVAAAKLGAAKSFDEASEAWADFLQAANSVYSKLETGSKGCGKSEAWFGRMKHERRTDPLLAYIHQARNVDEHGIEPTTEEHLIPSFSGNGYLRSFEVGKSAEGALTISYDADPGVKLNLDLVAVLRPVTDSRFGNVFNPPEEHLGVPLDVPQAWSIPPAAVASVAVTYLNLLVDAAAALPQRS